MTDKKPTYVTVYNELRLGNRSLSELTECTGETARDVVAALEHLEAEGLIVYCAVSNTYWIRRPGTMVVRAG